MAKEKEKDMIELWLCEDCTIAAVNNEYSGIEDENRVKEVKAGIKRIGWINADFDVESNEGYEEFSTKDCDCCHYGLAGSRHRFVKSV